MFFAGRTMSAGGLTDTSVRGVSRRRFIGYLIAAPTVVAGAQLLVEPAQAAIPTHQPVDAYDLTDFLTGATKPTSHLILVTVNPHGTVSLALPRAEVGQGITTATAMTIADKMDIALDKVNVTLADARPELVWNQLTGGSNSMHSIFKSIRVAAALAKGQLLKAAAAELGGDAGELTISGGVVNAPGGKTISLGSLATKGAVTKTTKTTATLKPQLQYKLVGTPQRRIDALAAVKSSRATRSPRSRACRRPLARSSSDAGGVARVRRRPLRLLPARPDMAAVALVKEVRASGWQITDANLDSLRNVCRCGTYPRIREAITAGAAGM
jgi:hypothetical protein